MFLCVGRFILTAAAELAVVWLFTEVFCSLASEFSSPAWYLPFFLLEARLRVVGVKLHFADTSKFNLAIMILKILKRKILSANSSLWSLQVQYRHINHCKWWGGSQVYICKYSLLFLCVFCKLKKKFFLDLLLIINLTNYVTVMYWLDRSRHEVIFLFCHSSHWTMPMCVRYATPWTLVPARRSIQCRC